MSLFASEKSLRPEALEVDQGPDTAGRWPWIWMILACIFLGTSGLVRVWQDWRFQNLYAREVVPVFSLSSLPKTVGNWEDKGETSALDPQIARIAGSVDSITRTYIDRRTGVVVDVLVLFGRSEQVAMHTPEICYPAVGYQLAESPVEQPIPLEGKNVTDPAALPRFRSMSFVRPGKFLERQEVFYGLRQNGHWSPEPDGNWKSLSLSPGMYKVQVQRRMAEQELRRFFDPEYNPTVQFLGAFLPEIESQIARAAKPPATGNPGPAQK
jgi:hypothetical protein